MSIIRRQQTEYQCSGRMPLCEITTQEQKPEQNQEYIDYDLYYTHVISCLKEYPNLCTTKA